MSYNVLDIAEWFLAENEIRSRDGGETDYITHLKLQKLLYYAQGCYCAITGDPLFEDDIVAWEHGPVVESVYHEYKCYGSNPIVYDKDYDVEKIDPKTQGVLKEVFDVFGQYSAWRLREKTHEEAPWKDTKRNRIIDLELIKDYFKKEYIE